jgi:hypothetical protein
VYNCIAWSAGDTGRWWWPGATGYWPSPVNDFPTIATFIEGFSTLGFKPCESRALETGTEKLALYADAEGNPSHMARQLPDGRWTSKLGRREDIEHDTLECLEGGAYGSVACILARSMRS